MPTTPFDRTSDTLIVGLIFCSLGSGAEALAGQPEIALTPPAYRVAEPSPALSQRAFSREFRPRARSVLDTDAVVGEPLVPTATTVWQRLSEARVHNRVSLMTLWQGAGSSVSLLADRKRGPMLQWSSRTLGHDAPGLLDELLPRSWKDLFTAGSAP